MAVTNTVRFGITRWSSGSDALSRAQLDGDHAALESLAVGYQQGDARPAAASNLQGFLFFDTGTEVFSYCDGSAWHDLGEFGSVSSLTAGGSTSDGSATTSARSDHAHSIPGYATPSLLDGTLSDGAATTFARSDHNHGYGTNSIPSAAIIANSIAGGKIATNAIGQAEITNGSVDSQHIANNAVTSAKISGSPFTSAKIVSLNSSKLTGTASVGISGNAATTDKWASPISISFSAGGDASGTLSNMDGSDTTLSVTLTPQLEVADIPTPLALSKLSNGTFGGSGTTIFPQHVRVGAGDKLALDLSDTDSIDYDGSTADVFTIRHGGYNAVSIGTWGLVFPSLTGADQNGESNAYRIGFAATDAGAVYVYINGLSKGRINA